MPVQKIVNRELPAAYHGDFASANPRFAAIGTEGAWRAGTGGVQMGSFVWLNEANRTANNSSSSTTTYTATGATIAAAGTGYAVGDTLSAPGVTATVSTVGASGAITAITLGNAGPQTTNPAGTGVATTTNGSGTGATLDVTSSTSTTYAQPDGFVRRGGLSIITSIPQAASTTLLPGQPLTVYEKGEFWVQLPTGVTAARKGAVYTDPTTGGIVASTASGAVETGYYFAESGIPGDKVKMSAYITPAS